MMAQNAGNVKKKKKRNPGDFLSSMGIRAHGIHAKTPKIFFFSSMKKGQIPP